nr:immunoglobulin light chain junction region [Macaca mulatta]MOX20860.1 immunoglobulin light chain junction region [Macaca mulatta]MOX21468.1 immunoglobulin light chain junction region [Macaca mulatta]
DYYCCSYRTGITVLF